jgi:hypothetical protein
VTWLWHGDAHPVAGHNQDLDAQASIRVGADGVEGVVQVADLARLPMRRLADD